MKLTCFVTKETWRLYFKPWMRISRLHTVKLRVDMVENVSTPPLDAKMFHLVIHWTPWVPFPGILNDFWETLFDSDSTSTAFKKKGKLCLFGTCFKMHIFEALEFCHSHTFLRKVYFSRINLTKKLPILFFEGKYFKCIYEYPYITKLIKISFKKL